MLKTIYFATYPESGINLDSDPQLHELHRLRGMGFERI